MWKLEMLCFLLVSFGGSETFVPSVVFSTNHKTPEGDVIFAAITIAVNLVNIEVKPPLFT